MTTRELTLLLLIPTIIVANLVLIIVVSLIYQELQAVVIFPPLFQIFWLTWVVGVAGIDVYAPTADWMPMPNALGWLLVAIGSSITFAIYYLLAAKIAALWLRHTHQSTTPISHNIYQ